MKKILVAGLMIAAVTSFQFCKPAATATGAKNSNITYVSHIQSIVAAKCTPCHFPPQGNKEPYHTYAAVARDVDEIILRVNKNPGEKGFMPLRHPKLSADTIQLFAAWKEQGLLEK